jgi:hypothetical protein
MAYDPRGERDHGGQGRGGGGREGGAAGGGYEGMPFRGRGKRESDFEYYGQRLRVTCRSVRTDSNETLLSLDRVMLVIYLLGNDL